MIGKLCIVKALLRNHADINKCNDWNTSPLNTASSHGHIDVVKCLLSSGSDINLTDILGQSPLFAASMSGHCDVVKCLLSSDAVKKQYRYAQKMMLQTMVIVHLYHTN
jgi:ankyrin repeat protein